MDKQSVAREILATGDCIEQACVDCPAFKIECKAGKCGDNMVEKNTAEAVAFFTKYLETGSTGNPFQRLANDPAYTDDQLRDYLREFLDFDKEWSSTAISPELLMVANADQE